MLRFHSLFFTSWPAFRSYITEVLIVIDATIAVLTLGVVELNLSCFWMELMDKLYGEAPPRDSW